ncbi:MAG: class I SAM-dependent DNA methyltransferase, partial [Candidatus Kapaibacteriota bacterium]
MITNSVIVDLVRDLAVNFSPSLLEDFIFAKFPDFDFKNALLTDFCENTRIADLFPEISLLGTTKLADDTIFCVVSARHSGELSDRSSKIKQFDLAKRILSCLSYDAGFFVFYDDSSNFRFSLVFSIYKGTRREFSHWKRFTYFIKKGKPYHTFLRALSELDCSTLGSISDAFSTLPLTKEFYSEIQNWYFWALDSNSVWFPGKSKEDNLIRLITRLIFVWFLKEKDLVPKEIFDINFLKDIIKNFPN